MYRHQTGFHWMIVVIMVCVGVGLTLPAEATVIEVPCGPDQEAEVSLNVAGVAIEVQAECSEASTVEVSEESQFREVVDVIVRSDFLGHTRVCSLQAIRTDDPGATHKVECDNDSYKVEAHINTCLDIIPLNEQGEEIAVGGIQRLLLSPIWTRACTLLSAPQLYDVWEFCELTREECIELVYDVWTESGGGRTAEECGLCPAP